MQANQTKEIILASRSPRRVMLLERFGINFTCKPAEIDETIFPSENPIQAVKRLAKMKADIAADSFGTGIVIAADTIVIYRGEILGQPRNKDDAYEKLSILSGQSHEVVTAICVKDISNNNFEIGTEITKVYFRRISYEEILRYINTGEPMDKAGAYGIQGIGAIFVEKIEGCFFNVVGLPLGKLSLMLKKFGVDLLKGY